MTLYNCRHDGDQYRITKFNDDINVESSYLCTLEECECPRGPHHTCRHRQMLPNFIAKGHVGDEWFFDFDRGGWVQGEAQWAEAVLSPNEILDDIPMKEPPSPSRIKRRF